MPYAPIRASFTSGCPPIRSGLSISKNQAYSSFVGEGEHGRPRCSERLHTCDCNAIDVRSLPRVPPEPPTPERIRCLLREAFPHASTQYDLTLTWPNGERLTVTVSTTTTRPFYGGARRWFVCPGCHRRCAKLYAPNRRSPFACRRCWNLGYWSQYLKKPDYLLVYRFVIHPPSTSRSAERQRSKRYVKKMMRLYGIEE